MLLSVPAAASRQRTGEEMRMDAYARARLAEADHDPVRTASAYRAAAALDPGNLEVARRSFRQAVIAGDKALAIQSAHVLDRAQMLPRDGTVLLLTDALDRKKWGEARRIVDRVEAEENLAFVVPFMKSWVSMRDGPYDPPTIPAAEPYAVFAVRYMEEQLLLQRLAQGDAAGAADAYTNAKARKTDFGPDERGLLAAHFARLGRRDLALDVLSGDETGGGSPDERLNRIIRQYRKASITPQTGLAMLMYRLSLDLYGRGEDIATLSIARVASLTDLRQDDVRLGVARAALAADYPEMALAEAEAIASASPAWLGAQAMRLEAMTAQDRVEEALTQARRLADTTGNARAIRLLGDMLMRNGDFAGAAAAYRTVRDRAAGKDDPALLLQLGGALEQAGQWQEARPLLEKVVALAPDSAAALNHLGYALADRGEDLPMAIKLLQKANRLRANEPAFIDSLGWAFFRAGQYDKALPLVESAVAAEPDNTEINEHLGDILWAAGRRFEARYAWKAALVGLTANMRTETIRARITGKIENGSAATATP